MKKALVWLVLLTILTAAGYAAAEETEGKRYDRERLNVGNPTPMQGCFFTSMWGGTTSDRDVQELLHAYSPVIWDRKLVRYRYDKSVIQNAVAMDDEDGNRTYILISPTARRSLPTTTPSPCCCRWIRQ